MRSLLSRPAPILTPTTPRRPSRSRCERRLLPLIVEAEPIDDRPGPRASGRCAGAALPLCARGVSVPTSTKPKPMARSSRGTRAFLSKPAAMPTGLGKSRPKIRLRQALVVGLGGARIEAKLEALDGEVVGPLRVERTGAGLAQAEQSIHGRHAPAGRCRPSAPRAEAARSRARRQDRAVRRDGGTARLRATAPTSALARAAPRSTASSTSSFCPAKCLASVPSS